MRWRKRMKEMNQSRTKYEVQWEKERNGMKWSGEELKRVVKGGNAHQNENPSFIMETAVTEVQDVPKALRLWDSENMTPCSLVDCYQTFWEACCRNIQVEVKDWGSKFLQNVVGHVPNHTVSQLRRAVLNNHYRKTCQSHTAKTCLQRG